MQHLGVAVGLLQGQEQRRLGLVRAVQTLQDEPVVVVHARAAGHEDAGAPQRLGRLGRLPHLRQEQAERVEELALVGVARDPVAQDALGFVVAPQAVQRVCEVEAHRQEGRVQAQGRPIGVQRRLGLAPGQVHDAEVQVRPGHVGLGQLGRAELRQGRVEGRPPLLRQGGRGHRREHAPGLHAHRADRVVEQRRDDGEEHLDRQALDVAQAAQGRHAHQRVVVGGRRGERGKGRRSGAGEQLERGGAHDRRLLHVGRQLEQTGDGLGPSGAGGGERLAVVPRALVRPAPLGDALGGPVRRLIGVAVLAGVRRAERDREIRARDPERVVAARVDHHVGARGHVAADAERAFGALRVEVVLERVVFLGHERGKAVGGGGCRVALRANAVAGRQELERVGVVAIAAGDPAHAHLALHERAIDVDLLQHLAVRVVVALVQPLRHEEVQELGAELVVRAQPVAARVARRAGVQLLVRAVAAQVDDQPGRLPGLHRSRGALPRPADMVATRTVTRLAADVDLAPGRVVGIRREVVALAQVGRVAVRAHDVPALIAARPVQRVVVPDLLVGVEIEPALPLDVPGDRQTLQATAGEAHQVLLQRVDAEGVLDPMIGQLAVGPGGVDEEASVAPEEARRDTSALEDGVFEVAQHRLLGRRIHRQVVVRAAPALELERMAGGAARVVDEGHVTGRRGGGRPG